MNNKSDDIQESAAEKTLLYGGDYYPEQWLDRPDILEKDLAYLCEAHMNVVSLGVFSWSVYEPEEGCYDFSWLEKIINRLYNAGISVILATPSGARPAWMAEKYKEVLRVNEHDQRNAFGARHNHCFTSPIYRKKVRAINMELASRFGTHPGVRLWHLSNEYGGECHCPLCQEAFRSWLKARYGSIEEVNRKWWTVFWSHHYDSFDQIESPKPHGEMAIHGLNLAWKRFVTDQTTDFMREEIRALRDGGAMQPVTTNLMYDFTGLNYGKLSEPLDVISWDIYPEWFAGKNIDIAMDTAMQHDYMRSLKHQPFLLMESSPSGTNWQPLSKLKKPGLLMNASLQAIAHGSDSVQYFQIRQSRGSSEKFHGAVIDQYGGNDTRVFAEVQEVGSVLKQLGQVQGSMCQAKAALIVDVENRWALEDAQGPRNKGLHYHETVLKSYTALKRYGLDVDVIDMDQPLDGYSFVAAPMLYMFRNEMEKKLRAFVENGGCLALTYWSGIVDEDDLCFIEGTPHDLLDVFGLRFQEIDALDDHEYNHAVPALGNSLNLNRVYACSNLCELITVSSAEVLMTYQSDFYAGKPVLTKNLYGKGEAWYICADMEQDFYTDVYARILQQNNICPLSIGLPPTVTVASRKSDEKTYLFIQNYGKESIRMNWPEDTQLILGDDLHLLKGMSTIVVSR